MFRKLYITAIFSLIFFVGVNAQENNISVENSNGGIKLTSSDNEYQVSINGRIYMDGFHYLDDATDLSSHLSINDIRFGTNIRWGKWSAKVNIGFGNNKVNIKDAFLRFNHKKNSTFTVGNFFEPFGIEASETSKNLRFIGSSNTTQAMGIGRSIGLGYTFYTQKLYLSTGLFAGSVNNHNKGDQGFSTSSKAAYSPIQNESFTFQIGGSFTYRKPEANGFSKDFNDDDYNRVVTFAAGPEHKFLNATMKGARSDMRFNFQSVTLSGPFMLQAEYTQAKVTRDDDYALRLMKDNPYWTHTAGGGYAWPIKPSDYPDWYGELRDIETKAYYAQLGFLLGDEYKYNPSTSYIRRPKSGTFEFLVRYDHTDLNDIDGTYFNGAYGDPDLNAALGGYGNMSIQGGKATTYSLAINYYVSTNVMFRLNYDYMDVDNQKTPLDENIGIFKGRVQINF
ncbi:MAG: hypothetical protein CR986_01175 [Ignavibacteriae bacterium]|nr:MAG: hypothetical protein CR986_01175 [Ignavibacteriota bacterium]